MDKFIIRTKMDSISVGHRPSYNATPPQEMITMVIKTACYTTFSVNKFIVFPG